MCGLVGVAGSMARNDVEVFHNMLLWDVVRGPDSTGIAAVKRTGREWDVFKRPEPSYYFQEHREYDRVASLGNAALIGHNRKATVGKINRANAHPFEFENIVGCHNGSIPYADRSDIPDHNKYDTDSEAIFHNLNVFSPVEFIPTLRGAYALVWYDKRDHSINMLRNDERPLCWVFSESRQTLYWASEPWMLHGALDRNNIKKEKAWHLSCDRWTKFKIPEKFNDKFEDPVEVKVEGKKAEPARFQGHPAASYGYGYPDYSERQGDYTPRIVGPNSPVGELGRSKAVNKPAKKETRKADKGTEESVSLPFDDDVPFGAASDWSEPKTVTINKGRNNERLDQAITGWKQEFLSPRVFRDRTGETCCGCDEVINFQAIWEGTDKVKFINSSQFMCETCIEDPWSGRWFVEEQARDEVSKKKVVH